MTSQRTGMERPWTICFVGLGKIVDRASFSAAIAAGANVIAGVDPKGRGATAAPRLQGKPIFGVIDEFVQWLEQQAVDARGNLMCYIAVGAGLNARLAAQLVAKGYHTVVEKPPGSLEDLQTLRDALASPHAGRCYALFHAAENPGIPSMRAWLHKHHADVREVRVDWVESMVFWHADQPHLAYMECARGGGGGMIRDVLFNPVSQIVALFSRYGYEFSLDDTAGSHRFDVPRNWAAQHGADAAPIEGQFRVRCERDGTRLFNVVVNFSGRNERIYNGVREALPETWEITYKTIEKHVNVHVKMSGKEVYGNGSSLYHHQFPSESRSPAFQMLFEEYHIGFRAARDCIFMKNESHIDLVTPTLIEETLAMVKRLATECSESVTHGEDFTDEVISSVGDNHSATSREH